MKLEYSRPWNGQGNFGDDLNEWIWEAIAPGLIDNDPSTLLLGIGSILEKWFTEGLPPESHKLVLGSGSGITGESPCLDDRWTIFGVRGPLTASFNNLPSDLVLTDPAMLVCDVVEVQAKSNRSGIGFMPHISTVETWDWPALCEQRGIEYISPRWDSRATLERISYLDQLITEAMHGAIVADALRVPWAAVSIAASFKALKWYDWGGSVGLPIKIHRLPELYRNRGSFVRNTASRVYLTANRLVGKPRRSKRSTSSLWEVMDVERALDELALPAMAQLSGELHLTRALERTRLAISRLLADKAAGRLGGH